MADPTTPTRDGPRLRVVGDCEGCAHRSIVGSWKFCRIYDPALDEDHDPDLSPGTLPNLVTPTWCPRLPDARAALGRELVEDSEGDEHG